MSQYSIITGRELIKILHNVGFSVVRIKGSHHRLEHSDGRKTTVPVHGKETLGPGMLLKILRDLDLSRNDLLGLL